MTIHEPLPSGVYGIADWRNYEDYWRDEDASWLQERAVTRYQTTSARTAVIAQPKPGQVTYNEETDRLELFSKVKNSWIPLTSLQNLVTVKDEPTGVTLAHRDAGGRGITFQPTQIYFDLPVNNNDVLFVSTQPNPGVTIRTGSGVSAKFITDATSLVLDKPLSAPSLALTGAGPTVLTTGGKSADFGAGTVTAYNIVMGGTLSGMGTINGSKGTIGGVKIGITPDQLEASAGLISQGGIAFGDADSLKLQNRNTSTGALGTSYIDIGSDITIATAASAGMGTRIINRVRIDQAAAPLNCPWVLPGTDGYLAPVVISAAALDPAQFPTGTIWIQ
jgi:hypothetical protein